ncbi:MAG: GTPase HflX [Actinobacteria bacterium]|nr:GTPase HflX [Actinomycetota bacterium]
MTDRSRPRAIERAVLESPLSATWRPAVREKAVLVGVGPGIGEDDLDELAALADSAGAEPIARLVQSRSEPDPATFIGKGKLEEVHRVVHANDAAAVILDRELSPGQLRSLEERLGVKVIDRTALILDIFALHARSREGKAQVELAQLNYLLPRLRGWGEAMSRLGGGIGTRGPGETKLEVDRQHIRRRVTKLRRDIRDLARTRDVKRGRRQRSNVPQVAIAGYTNAGKSTLMNRLTGADVLVADQLFATLDPTTRRLSLPRRRRAVLSDTVGFVSKLPHDLVEAFRSTLEEVTQADLILHVADAASGELERQVEAVRRVLEEIGAGSIPEVLALNKIDRVAGSQRVRLAVRHRGSVAVSALTGEGVEGLVEAVAAALPDPPVEVTVLVPWGREDITARLYRDAEVLSTEADGAGTLVRARVGLRELAAVRDFVVRETRAQEL